MKRILALLALPFTFLSIAACSSLTPEQRAVIKAAEVRGGEAAIKAFNDYLDSVAGGGAAGKAIVPIKAGASLRCTPENPCPGR